MPESGADTAVARGVVKEEGSESRPAASVIIVNYNGRHFLQDCLASLSLQTFRNFETWIADNGSTDGSVDFVRSNFPWAHVVPFDRNLGFCAGNNAAIKQARGELIVLLNNDTRAESDWLSELLAAAQRHPEASIFASRILHMMRPEILYAAGDSYAPYGLAYRRGEGMSAPGQYERTEEVFSACACAALYRRSMLDQIGLFDEDYFSNYEDVDLAFRARLAGYRCLYVPRAVVYHYGSGTAGTENPRLEFLEARNSEYLFFKNMPGSLLLRYLPAHLLLIAGRIFGKLCRGSAIPYLKGKRAFLVALPKVMRKRAEIQRRRTARPEELARLMDTGVFSRVLRKMMHSVKRRVEELVT